jgi:hypothetical protein
MNFLEYPNKPDYLELDIIRETLNARKTGLPNNFIVVFDTGSGSRILINTAETDNKGEATLYMWDFHPEFKENDISKIYPSYGAFLLDKTEETLKTRREWKIINTDIIWKAQCCRSSIYRSPASFFSLCRPYFRLLQNRHA